MATNLDVPTNLVLLIIFLEQINGSQVLLAQAFKTLYQLQLKNNLLEHLLEKIIGCVKVSFSGLSPVIAFDEIQVFTFEDYKVIMSYTELKSDNLSWFDNSKKEPTKLFPPLHAIQKTLLNLSIGSILAGINPQYSEF